MTHQLANAEGFEEEAEKKLNGWNLFGLLGSKYEDAAELFKKAGNAYRLAGSWDRAGAVYVKSASCNLKLDSKHEAADAFVIAAECYKKTNITKSISCLEQSAQIYLDTGSLYTSARYYKDIAELYEREKNLEKSIEFYERAADLYKIDSEDANRHARNKCREKIAKFASQLEQYSKAIEIYEDIARQSVVNSGFQVKGLLLNAGICQLCRGDVVAIQNGLDRYRELDLTFSGTREYRLLADLAAAMDEEDVSMFTDAVKEFDSLTRLDPWKTSMLLRVKEAILMAQEDDLT